ncbi:MAG: exodeoxyribonuclease VII large subunit [Bacteroidales bacterium]|nr:exodeoxyribonuclease VII large subunit [Bacteroidales bacterium]
MDNQRETFIDKPVYSLSEISKSIKSIINKTYTRAYYIKAELLKLNAYPHSGHCFPELVEKEGDKIITQMRAVIWKTQVEAINEKFVKITGEKLKDNINILCLATIEFNPQYGLGLYIQDIEPTYTLGELMKNKLAVINKLKQEGVFSANKSLQLPLLPKRIAIISVETSKGYSDFIISLKDNNWNYCFECELFTSILQGDKAISTISARLEEIEKRKQDFDCVVIIRGGGGDVGLSCYDDYTLAHKVATFPLPIISGIGHSTNESVTDMVAFANKITPTEVAYFLIQKFHDFAIQVEELQDQMRQCVMSILEQEKHKLSQIENNHRLITTRFITHEKSKLDNLQNMMKLSAKNIIENQKKDLQALKEHIQLLHPDNVLKRGYSITLLNGKAVTQAKQIKSGDILTTRLFKGNIESEVK